MSFVGSILLAFANDSFVYDRDIRWLSYCSAIFIAFGGLLLFSSHWTFSISSELRLSTIYIQYGYSTYLIVTAALISLLSMSLILWRLVSAMVHERSMQ